MSKARQVVIFGAAEGLFPGSKAYPCACCKAQVWLAPSGQRMVGLGAIVSCTQCLKHWQPDEEPTEAALAPGATEEIAHWRNRN